MGTQVHIFEGLEGRKLEGMKNKREGLNLGVMWRNTLWGNFVYNGYILRL